VLNRRQFSSLPALLVGTLAGCGGGAGDPAGKEGSQGTDNARRAAEATAARTRAGWKSVKIGGGGYVPGLVYHPTTPNLLYARTDVGGAYRWDAAKTSWVPLTDGFGPREANYQGA
jgi:hypothetical protein